MAVESVCTERLPRFLVDRAESPMSHPLTDEIMCCFGSRSPVH